MAGARKAANVGIVSKASIFARSGVTLMVLPCFTVYEFGKANEPPALRCHVGSTAVALWTASDTFGPNKNPPLLWTQR